MTELDLDRLLARGARRLRLQRALYCALAVQGLSILLAAAGILAARLTAASSEWVLLLLSVSASLAIWAFAAAFAFQRQDLDRVALMLDRKAGTDEHLITWHQFRRIPAESLSEVQRQFKAAQLAATLERAREINPRRLLAWRFPEWTRGLWLALVLLCCALLMPPAPARTPVKAGLLEAAAPLPDTLMSGGAGEAGAQSFKPAPRVQVLSPTELLQRQLLATDPGLTAEKRSEALKDLLRRIGSVPESELAPEVREVLALLRGDGAERSSGEKNADGSQQTLADRAHEPAEPGRLDGAANLAAQTQQGLAAAEQDFPDVKEPLRRYYGDGKANRQEARNGNHQ